MSNARIAQTLVISEKTAGPPRQPDPDEARRAQPHRSGRVRRRAPARRDLSPQEPGAVRVGACMRILLAVLSAAVLVPAAPAAGAEAPEPMDPQSWVLPEDMTWDDYRPIPGFDWADDDRQPPKKLRAALILGDHSDRRFLVTAAGGLGRRSATRSARAASPRTRSASFYEDMLNTPQALNRGHTINEYWLEDSYGLVGIDMDAFGPYRMDRPEYQYGLAEYGQEASCPTGETCDGDFDTELLAKSAADVTAGAGDQRRQGVRLPLPAARGLRRVRRLAGARRDALPGPGLRDRSRSATRTRPSPTGRRRATRRGRRSTRRAGSGRTRSPACRRRRARTTAPPCTRTSSATSSACSTTTTTPTPTRRSATTPGRGT